MEKMARDVVVDCGWGRLIFGHTFKDNNQLAEVLCDEEPGRRDIALYLRDPHVVLSLAPQEFFLDPSHTYRLWMDQYRPSQMHGKNFVIRKLQTEEDIEAVNRIYVERHMVPPGIDFLWQNRKSRDLTFLVAADTVSSEVIGTVLGVDHQRVFNDPENGSSLWCLAVDPQTTHPGVGEDLVRHLAAHFLARGRAFMDLSVMHDNTQAIALYEKLGFQRVPVFCIKHKNPINEPLFTAPALKARLNPYAKIIVDEARRRGIAAQIIDEEGGYFSLTLGGRSVVCRESLTELTNAVAMSRCQDKAVTLRLLRADGLRVPEQQVAATPEENYAFLKVQERVVIKPADGEQGAGISVDVRTVEELDTAIKTAKQYDGKVLLEKFHEGQDLRVIVIGYKVVAGAIRRPAQITGNGHQTVRELIEKQSRRRAAATGGESRIPLDAETKRCIRLAGYEMDSILPMDKVLAVRKTANLHTGGTIHDITEHLHPQLIEAAKKAARALDIPVVGLDFLVASPMKNEYVIIEANERPGLANHEPQPTAQRFIDLLFPQTAPVI
jgi:GNAT-family acetyltransferase (TIGR03103 family)